MPDERDLRAPIMRLVDVLRRNFTPPEYIPGCLVKDVTDKDEYTTDNGWIEAICGQHNQQRVRYLGKPADPVADSTVIDVIHYPDTKTFKVDWQGGTASVGGLNSTKVSKIYESDAGTVALEADADGDIGIAVTPASRLDVAVSSADAIPTDGALITEDSSILRLFNESDTATYSGVVFHTRTTNSSRVLIGLEHQSNYIGDMFFRYRTAAGGSTERFRLTSGGVLYVNDTANTDMTIGLTINQAGNDDEIVALKSSDVTHDMTDYSEADTYGDMLKYVAGSGGLDIRGFTAGTVGLDFTAFAENGGTAKTTSADAAIILAAVESTGDGGASSMSADANILAVRNATTTVFLVDEDGDEFWQGTQGGTISDHYDDSELLNGFKALTSPKDSPAAKRFTGFLDDTESILVQQGVLSAPLAEGGLVSTKGLNGLFIDAIYQLAGRVKELEEKLGGRDDV